MDHVILPLGWEGVRDLYPNDAPLPAFYLVIVGEALLASFFHKSDPAYANTCLQAATKLWNYLQASDTHKTAYNPPTIPPNHDFLKNWFDQHFLGSSFAVGDSLFASTLFYRATGDRHWLEIAIEQANALVALQFGGDVQENPLAACFRVAQGQDEVASGTYYGVFGPIALCDILDILPNHADSVRWRDAIRRIADQCLIMSGRNAWGLIPSYWYRTDPGHGRPIGDGYYKYYYCHSGLHIGVNNEILAKAIFLLRARKILGDQRLLDLACRQFDWVVGCNPFDQSSIEGVGYNQGVRLMGEFIPPTPQIPGAVMTGIAGNAHDNPVKQISVSNEYDIPPTSLLMWFLSELTAEESGLEPSSCVCGERR